MVLSEMTLSVTAMSTRNNAKRSDASNRDGLLTAPPARTLHVGADVVARDDIVSRIADEDVAAKHTGGFK